MITATRPAPLTLTDRAATRIRELMNNSADPVLGLRVSIKTRGCSGMSYALEYARETKKFEDVVEDKGAKLFIDPAAIMFLIGSEVDYIEDRLESKFVFNNPNEKGRCGCGESFNV